MEVVTREQLVAEDAVLTSHLLSNGTLRGVKRVVDCVGAFLGILLLLPLCLVVAVLIKLDSPGPVLYAQVRLGRDGRKFTIYKFRSMYMQAEELLEEVLRAHPELRAEYAKFHKLQYDPRVTRVGRILRKYSLDELPQLINVFRGEMSLVGPRPYMPNERERMSGRDGLILSIRPGITGLWQTCGRNMLSFEDRVALDLQYIRSWSFWLDVYVLSRTLPVVVRGEGAS